MVYNYKECKQCIDQSNVACRFSNHHKFTMCSRSGDEPSGEANFDHCSNDGLLEPDLLNLACPYKTSVCGNDEEFTLVPDDMDDGLSAFVALGSAVDSLKDNQCIFYIKGDISLNSAFASSQDYTNDLSWYYDIKLTEFRGMKLELFNSTCPAKDSSTEIGSNCPSLVNAKKYLTVD